MSENAFPAFWVIAPSSTPKSNKQARGSSSDELLEQTPRSESPESFMQKSLGAIPFVKFGSVGALIVTSN